MDYKRGVEEINCSGLKNNLGAMDKKRLGLLILIKWLNNY